MSMFLLLVFLHLILNRLSQSLERERHMFDTECVPQGFEFHELGGRDQSAIRGALELTNFVSK